VVVVVVMVVMWWWWCGGGVVVVVIGVVVMMVVVVVVYIIAMSVCVLLNDIQTTGRRPPYRHYYESGSPKAGRRHINNLKKNPNPNLVPWLKPSKCNIVILALGHPKTKKDGEILSIDSGGCTAEFGHKW